MLRAYDLLKSRISVLHILKSPQNPFISILHTDLEKESSHCLQRSSEELVETGFVIE